MPSVPPKLGASLLEATQARDIDEALSKMYAEYLALKLKDLQATTRQFEEKWDMSFQEFKQSLREETLPKDSYDFDTERDFWKWEEAETLKAHYGQLRQEWT
jgi:hypothetical protein